MITEKEYNCWKIIKKGKLNRPIARTLAITVFWRNIFDQATLNSQNEKKFCFQTVPSTYITSIQSYTRRRVSIETYENCNDNACVNHRKRYYVMNCNHVKKMITAVFLKLFILIIYFFSRAYYHYGITVRQ